MLKHRIGRVLLVTGLAGALLGVTLAGAAPSASPPVGDWRMDDREWTVLVDSSASGNNGTILGNPTWVDGPARSGAPLRRDGYPADHATVPDSASLDISAAITMAAWVKPERAATTNLIKKAVTTGHDGQRLRALAVIGTAGTQSVRALQPGRERRHVSGSTRRPRIRSPAPPGCTWPRPMTGRRSGCT